MSNQESNFKIDTKEKMHVLTPEVPVLAANMTADFKKLTTSFLKQPVKNLVINFSKITSIDNAFGMELANIQQNFYNENVSMVFCNFSKEVENSLREMGLLEKMNHTPTESEAWDIVQMEEIEREFL